MVDNNSVHDMNKLKAKKAPWIQCVFQLMSNLNHHETSWQVQLPWNCGASKPNNALFFRILYNILQLHLAHLLDGFQRNSTCTSSIGWEDTMDTADVVFCLACLKRHLLCPACQTLANKRESLWCIGGWAQSTHSISAFNELAWKSNFGPGMPCLSKQMLCLFMCLMPSTPTKMDQASFQVLSRPGHSLGLYGF